MSELTSLIFGLLSLGAGQALAENSAPTITPVGTVAQVGGSIAHTIGNLNDQIYTVLTVLAGIAAVLYLVWYGIQYITSAGDPSKVKAARSSIINAIIGIVIITAAYGIIRLAIVIGHSISEAASSANTPSTPATNPATGTTPANSSGTPSTTGNTASGGASNAAAPASQTLSGTVSVEGSSQTNTINGTAGQFNAIQASLQNGDSVTVKIDGETQQATTVLNDGSQLVTDGSWKNAHTNATLTYTATPACGTGTVTVSANSNGVVGNSADFSKLKVGDTITVKGTARTITSIVGTDQLIVDSPWPDFSGCVAYTTASQSSDTIGGSAASFGSFTFTAYVTNGTNTVTGGLHVWLVRTDDGTWYPGVTPADGSGKIVFDHVLPGTYHLEVERASANPNIGDDFTISSDNSSQMVNQ